jgi:hypothetical protein
VATQVIKIVQDEPTLFPYSFSYDHIIEDYCNSMKNPSYLALEPILDFIINLLGFEIIENFPVDHTEYFPDSFN